MAFFLVAPNTTVRMFAQARARKLVVCARLGVVDVLTLTHHYNSVHGHRTGSNNSGVKITSGGKQIITIIHTIPEENRLLVPQTKI